MIERNSVISQSWINFITVQVEIMEAMTVELFEPSSGKQ